jgi:transposase
MKHRELESTMIEARRWNGVTEGARRATGVTPLAGHLEVPSIVSPDPEVPEKKPRRKYTAQYKLRILQAADACTEPGQLGALLRREGLYSSNLTTWKRQREEGLLHALSGRKRGRKPKPKNALASRVAQLERDNERLKKKLSQAQIIIEVQKKVSEILGISQNLPGEGESD